MTDDAKVRSAAACSSSVIAERNIDRNAGPVDESAHAATNVRTNRSGNCSRGPASNPSKTCAGSSGIRIEARKTARLLPKKWCTIAGVTPAADAIARTVVAR